MPSGNVPSDIVTAIDWRQVSLFGLLDLSAAFDGVHHEIVLQCLQNKFDVIVAACQLARRFMPMKRILIDWLTDWLDCTAMDSIICERMNSAGLLPGPYVGHILATAMCQWAWYAVSFLRRLVVQQATLLVIPTQMSRRYSAAHLQFWWSIRRTASCGSRPGWPAAAQGCGWASIFNLTG